MVNSSLSILVFNRTCLWGCFFVVLLGRGLITKCVGLGYFLFLFFCPEELYQAVQSKILLRQHLLLKIIMKRRLLKQKKIFFKFFLVFQDPISPSPTCHPADAICHPSWSLLINKETVSWQPALCIITQEPADLQRPTIKSKYPFSFYKTFYPHLQYKHIKSTIKMFKIMY